MDAARLAMDTEGGHGNSGEAGGYRLSVHDLLTSGKGGAAHSR